LDICGHVDGGEVVILKTTVTPPSGPQGTTFTVEMDYKVINATGPGSLDIVIVPPSADQPLCTILFLKRSNFFS
jgi:hypothetical protein